ncbi:MAG: thiamine pyrophosphate-dependent dehydrogenase E1 component subunit alpha [Planctomycetota bacterium]|nr:thiamine pyrophosphate-dependent dehydrogenase E1 component subunit alpha [Planctomycetota bacterium]
MLFHDEMIDPFQACQAFASASAVDADLQVRLYTLMLKCRRAEERAAELAETREVGCPVHLYLGQEAVSAGVCTALKTEDQVFGTHRSHGHFLCKGGGLRPLFAELLGKATGCARGRGGSMHLIDTSCGIPGTTPIVAASIPMAAGAALANKMKKNGLVAVAFFGDGATEEGVFHETMVMAAIWDLPVVFICENNFYASHLPLKDRRKRDNLADAGKPYSIPSARIDGNNVLEVHRYARAAVEHARSGRGPSFLECRTYRWRGHVGPAWEWNLGIRKREEVEEWLARCPIRALEQQLLAQKLMREEDMTALRQKIDEEIEDALAFARQSPYPAMDTLLRHVYVER